MDVFPIAVRERMVLRLLGLGEAFKSFGPPLLVARRGFGCERAEPVLKEEERMDDRLKARRRVDLSGNWRQEDPEVWLMDAWGVSIRVLSSG